MSPNKSHIDIFAELGKELRHNGVSKSVVNEAVAANSWFTPENINYALAAISETMLDREHLADWISRNQTAQNPKEVGVIMAGNIPLVGFADMLYVVMSGHRCHIKPSSKDTTLIMHTVELLRKIDPNIPIYILSPETNLDAVIATGSNNTNRYFEQAFGAIPRLLRGTRTSVAVLTGRESEEQVRLLGDDIFLHFGMGCRNVSRIFVPEGYDTAHLIKILSERKIDHEDYTQAYRRRRAVMMMRGQEFFDGEFFTITRREGFSESLSDILLTEYTVLSDVERWLSFNDSGLQCVVSASMSHPRGVDFGAAQRPSLCDYPDGVDVMKFLYII